ncbi:MAG: bifunctional folylpolyglutamate synthase/dihydrofolate synthase, partial [Bacteroidales bacterium]|nr:bifunctional folylpolyglutamate synthase/dihydrofolate synthase [Bacteroidales bacterium]
MNFEEEYNKEIEALFKRFPSVQKAKFTEAYKPGIDRMEEFDALLGHPHRSYKTVHVAGTNGKGSVSSMLASSLMANGCKTGLYTSPHILDFRERMKVDGEMVPKEWVYDFIVKYRSEFERLDLSFFEITTSMAFKWFEEMGVDWAVIEVGLGGRFDSTNIITPELSVITSIGLDHCDILGHTLAKIAREKAGIIKKGVPAVVGEVTPETWTVFLTRAAKMDSQLTIAEHSDPSALGSMDKMLAEMDLQGEYQRKNLRTVLCSLDALGIKVTPEIMDGIVHTAARTGFHGRWEKISDQPDVICDIGHNAHALRNNFAQLSGLLESGEYATLIIIYAVMSDKDLKSIIPLM